MLARKFFGIILLSLLLFTLGVQGQVIMVTSNADSGPGSLREALKKAETNGTAAIDEIRFNLPGNTENDRTITLLSELPHVRSKTIIDATTQPGAKFGRSDAKVAIRCDRLVYVNPYLFTGAFYVEDAQDVEIYGFYLYNFYDLINKYPTSPDLVDAGIQVASSRNVIIGAPGKGNVLEQNEYGIFVDADLNLVKKSDQIRIQSNWIGLKPDGTIAATSPGAIGLSVYANDSHIGGDVAEKGNRIAGHRMYGIAFGGENTLVRFNSLGLDGDGKPSAGVAEINSFPQGGASNNLVADNLGNYLRILLRNVKNFTVVRNKNILAGENIIGISLSQDGTIGTDRVEDSNTLFGGQVHIFASDRVQVRKGSIYCIDKPLINADTKIPKIQVLVNSDSEYSGTASPNSEIYIYNDNSGCATCNPHEFYTKVLADASGNWKITGNLAGKKLVSNATLINTSSAYTVPTLNTVGGSQFIVTHPACDKDEGSLRLASPQHVLRVEWYNNSDQKIADGPEVRNLGPGRYYAKAYSGSCFIRSADVDLSRPLVTVMDAQIDVQNPSCGTASGHIKNLSVITNIPGTPGLEWRDKAGKVLQTGTEDITGLGPGEYTLFVTTTGKCVASYGPVVLVNSVVPGVTFPDYPAIIAPAFCGLNNGSIKIDMSNGPKPSAMKWINGAGVQVGNTNELTALDAGEYKLYLTTADGCEGLYKTYTVNRILPLSLDVKSLTVGADQCLTGKGSISGIQVNGGVAPYSYSWTNENNQLVGTVSNLTLLKAGKYTLRVSDAGGPCNAVTQVFEVPNQGEPIEPPQLNDVVICTPGPATVRVLQVQSGKYRIYENKESTAVLAENTSGVFNVTSGMNSTFYVTYTKGTCESERVPVNISVTTDPVIVPNTISPNGDQVNDVWEIKGLSRYASVRVSIYNRYGQTMFQSKGYQTPFNGERRGKPLPDGTYYYVIDLQEGCGMIKGSLFLVR